MTFKSFLFKTLKRIAPRLGNTIKLALTPEPHYYPIFIKIGTTSIDTFHIERSGIVTLQGWQSHVCPLPSISLRVDGIVIEANEAYRTYRPDIASNLQETNYFLGFAIEFILGKSLLNSNFEILIAGQPVWAYPLSQMIVPLHFEELLTTSTVKHRENIYGYGLPSKIVSAEVIHLVETYVNHCGRVLDFGCGRGNLVEHLRKKGLEAYGIEMDNPILRDALLPECKEFITLYHGELPLPFADGEFDIVIATEVIEHVPEYFATLQEISRISNKAFLMTVPDISALPRCFPQGVVPWHLLEGTHVNFFTERSLEKLLSTWWAKTTFLKIGNVQVNDSHYRTCVAVFCEKTSE